MIHGKTVIFIQNPLFMFIYNFREKNQESHPFYNIIDSEIQTVPNPPLYISSSIICTILITYILNCVAHARYFLMIQKI